MTTKSDIIIVEVPHQFRARAWSVLGWKALLEVLDRRNERRGYHPGYRRLTAQDVEEMIAECAADDDDGEVPDDLAEALRIAREAGGVWEVGDPSRGLVYQPHEPDLAEHCREWIDDDLSWSTTLETPEELRDFLAADLQRHRGPAAQAAARREAIALGWVDDDNDDEA